jgi:hypothetical protein
LAFSRRQHHPFDYVNLQTHDQQQHVWTRSMSVNVPEIFQGNAGAAGAGGPVNTKAFFLNLATGAALFAFQVSGFFLLKSSNIGRRI